MLVQTPPTVPLELAATNIAQKVGVVFDILIPELEFALIDSLVFT